MCEATAVNQEWCGLDEDGSTMAVQGVEGLGGVLGEGGMFEE